MLVTPLRPAYVLAVLSPFLAAQQPGAIHTGHPAAFLANQGQWDPSVRHHVRHGGMLTWLTDTGWTTRVEVATTPPDPGLPGILKEEGVVRGVTLRTTLLGGTGPVAVLAAQPGGARYHMYLGNDPARWVTNLQAHRRLVYQGMLPGVDVAWRVADGQVHYDLHLAPFVETGEVRFRIEGQEGLTLSDDGALVVRTEVGELRHTAPVAWQPLPGGDKRPVACRFELLAPDTFGFALAERDVELPVIIDPGLLWSTFLGTTQNEFPGFPDSISVAPGGDVLICGNFLSGTSFPYTTGTYQNAGAVRDGFVTCYSAAGTMLWSAWIGGDGLDRVNGVEALANGEVVFAGRTSSSNWPVSPGAFQPMYGGGTRDGFAARLSGNGSQLSWSTYLGGSVDDANYSVDVHPSGAVVVVGSSDSSNFPVAGQPVQPTRAPTICTSNADGTVSVLDPSLSGAAQLVASTYFGGGCQDYLQFLALDGDEIVASGGTQSRNFPVTANAWQPAHSAGATNEGCIVRFNLSLSAQTYGTYFGGNGVEDARVTADAAGRIVVAGWTSSNNLPTTPGAFQPAHGGGTNDCYVGVLDTNVPPAQQLVYLTYLGGAVNEGVNDVVVERSGLITITGAVSSGNFPVTTGCLQPTFAGGSSASPFDAFVTRLDPRPGAAVQLVYSTFLGGSQDFDFGFSVALTDRGGAAVAVNVGSGDFPVTPGAAQPTHGGGPNDAAVSVLDMLPAGVNRYGDSSPACYGPLYLSVNSEPLPGNATFEVHVNEAPPSAFGALFLGVPATMGMPLPGLGITTWVQQPAFISAPLMSDALGFARLSVPIPAGVSWPVGGMQAAWLVAAGCAPIVASDALQ